MSMNLKAISIKKSKDMSHSIDLWYSKPADIMMDNSICLSNIMYYTLYKCGIGQNLDIRTVSHERRSLKTNVVNLEIRSSIGQLFGNRPVLESYMKWIGASR